MTRQLPEESYPRCVEWSINFGFATSFTSTGNLGNDLVRGIYYIYWKLITWKITTIAFLKLKLSFQATSSLAETRASSSIQELELAWNTTDVQATEISSPLINKEWHLWCYTMPSPDSAAKSPGISQPGVGNPSWNSYLLHSYILIKSHWNQ